MAFNIVKLSDIEHIEFYVPEKRMSITSAYNNHLWNGRKCNAISNGTLFDMGTQLNSTITYGATKEKGRIGYLFNKEGIVFDGNEVRFGTLDEALKDKCDFVGSAPLLSKNGQWVYDWGNRKPSPSVTGKHIRTGIGLSNDSFIMYTSDDEITLETLNSRLKAKGCNVSINVDGGGSTCMMVNGKYARNTSRLLANFIMVWTKQPTASKPEKEDDEMVVKEGIVVNGEKIEFNTITKDGVTYMEFRKLAELLGCQVGYDAATKTKSLVKK